MNAITGCVFAYKTGGIGGEISIEEESYCGTEQVSVGNGSFSYCIWAFHCVFLTASASCLDNADNIAYDSYEQIKKYS